MFEFLEKSVPITSQQWSEDTVPLVSIDCITYNHENYIRDAIEGFLMQKTTFPVEILIHDDASTDKTASIVREYEEKYPHLIKPIYQTENQYSKRDGSIGRIQRERACGKYYATCEGDDYWTDSLKLQKQVDFLESNSDFFGTAHACKIEYISQYRNKIVIHRGKSEIDLGYYLTSNIFITTASLLYRTKVVENYPEWTRGLFAGDFVLKYLILTNGKIKYFDEVMSVYNKGVPGSWSKQLISQKRIDKEFLDNLFVLQKISELTDYKYSYEVSVKSKRLFYRYIARSISIQNNFNKLKLFIGNFIYFKIPDYKTIIKGIVKGL